MQTKILGVDYGRKKIGLAIAEGPLAEPLEVIRVNSSAETIKKIKTLIETKEIEKVIVGISEGEMGQESENFSLDLGQKLKIPVETFDETLSTQEAQKMAIEAGIKRARRKSLEDAFAAAVMLQSYLDSYV